MFGGAIAIAIPLAAFALLYLINYLSGGSLSDGRVSRMNSLILVCIFLNLIPFRIYMVNLKSDRTGQGILMITFAEALAYFILTLKFQWSAAELFAGQGFFLGVFL
jgi:hypothetical protein